MRYRGFLVKSDIRVDRGRRVGRFGQDGSRVRDLVRGSFHHRHVRGLVRGRFHHSDIRDDIRDLVRGSFHHSDIRGLVRGSFHHRDGSI